MPAIHNITTGSSCLRSSTLATYSFEYRSPPSMSAVKSRPDILNLLSSSVNPLQAVSDLWEWFSAVLGTFGCSAWATFQDFFPPHTSLCER